MLRLIMARKRKIPAETAPQNDIFVPETVDRHAYYRRAVLELFIPSVALALSSAIDAVTHLLSSSLDQSQLRRLQQALAEALQNSHEHGNLGITYEEKIAFNEAGTFDSELRSRGRQAIAEGKEIYLRAEVEPGMFRCLVRDQGKGFDWKSMTDPRLDPGKLQQPSGRGVFLIRNFFDAAEYNEFGNELSLEKKLAK